MTLLFALMCAFNQKFKISFRFALSNFCYFNTVLNFWGEEWILIYLGHFISQGLLDSLLQSVGCTYGAIIVNGIVTAASKDWWCLKGPEICLITFVACQSSTENFTDFPVFLPISSPKVIVLTFSVAETFGF